MYTGLLHSHNMFRWLVLLLLVLTILFSISGWIRKGNWTKKDRIAGLLLVIFVDLQFIIGMALYAFFSPITKAALSNFGAAMKNEDLRFYAVEHISIMLIALILIHIGRAKGKRTNPDWKKHRVSAIFYTLGLLLILSAIPWERAFF